MNKTKQTNFQLMDRRPIGSKLVFDKPALVVEIELEVLNQHAEYQNPCLFQAMRVAAHWSLGTTQSE